jgi:hypothetical protein
VITPHVPDVVLAYILGLWGRERRLYALAYWLSLTGEGRQPTNLCFGAVFIEERLNRMARDSL